LHCVLVPNAKQRALVLPQAPEAPAQAAPPAERNACQSLCDIRGRQSGVRATGSLVGVFSSGGGLIQAAVGIGGGTGRLLLSRAGRPGQYKCGARVEPDLDALLVQGYFGAASSPPRARTMK
jgi:hypothetical protein